MNIIAELRASAAAKRRAADAACELMGKVDLSPGPLHDDRRRSLALDYEGLIRDEQKLLAMIREVEELEAL